MKKTHEKSGDAVIRSNSWGVLGVPNKKRRQVDTHRPTGLQFKITPFGFDLKCEW